jgi:hypothetical protein
LLAGKLVSWGAEELVEPEGWEKSPDEAGPIWLGDEPGLVRACWIISQMKM